MADQQLQVVGKRVALADGVAKVTGTAMYSHDVRRPGMLHARLLLSPHPHARISKIDATQAEALDGVGAVITYRDVPAVPMGPDPYFVMSDHIRFVGEEVAAVAALDRHIADEAVSLIKVQYEVLPAVFDMDKALEPNAPRIHDAGNLFGGAPILAGRGDVTKGLAEAEVVIEGTYSTTGQVVHALQPRGCVAEWDGDGNLTLWDATQQPFYTQQVLSRVLGMPLSKVRIESGIMGGGFGESNEYRYYGIAALLARKARRPVRLEYTRREESLCEKKRHPTRTYLKIGVKRDGRITAMDSRTHWEKGAYAGGGAGVPNSGAGALTGNYLCPNTRNQRFLVYTNHSPYGAFRGYGNPQASFALEVCIDEVAERLGIDPAEYRIQQFSPYIDQDKRTPFSSYGLVECIRKGAQAIGWERRNTRPGDWTSSKMRGIGMGVLKHTGGFGLFGAVVKVQVDGSAQVLTGSVDMGTGSRTTLAQIAAEELGIPYESVRVINGDTHAGPYGDPTSASRTAYASGLPVKMAAADARGQILDLATKPDAGVTLISANPADLEVRASRIYVKGSNAPGLSITEVLKKPVIIIGRANWNAARIPQAFGAQFADVEVDLDTGDVQVMKFASAHDVGRALNPAVVENQILGAVHHGLGYALGETLLHDPWNGMPLNPTLVDYPFRTTLDMPEIVPIIVETIDPVGPFGAKGVGEPGLVPTAAAISNAIYNAIGIRFRQMPFTADKILGAVNTRPKPAAAAGWGWHA